MNVTFRNQNCVPDLSDEGVFLKSLDVPKDEIWFSQQLKPYERMHAHHTLASARRFAYFKPYSGLIPQDELDFVLESPYNHTFEVFPEKIDVFLQNETMGAATWRRLRNTIDIKPASDSRATIKVRPLRPNWIEQLPYKLNQFHPVIVSGLGERRHPSNVKLMNSSHHSPQTNPGYSRQDSDGNRFQY